MKIKNRSRKRSHKRDAIGVRRIRTFPFSSNSANDSVAYVPLIMIYSENQIVRVGSRSGRIKHKQKTLLVWGHKETWVTLLSALILYYRVDVPSLTSSYSCTATTSGRALLGIWVSTSFSFTSSAVDTSKLFADESSLFSYCWSSCPSSSPSSNQRCWAFNSESSSGWFMIGKRTPSPILSNKMI